MFNWSIYFATGRASIVALRYVNNTSNPNKYGILDILFNYCSELRDEIIREGTLIREQISSEEISYPSIPSALISTPSHRLFSDLREILNRQEIIRTIIYSYSAY